MAKDQNVRFIQINGRIVPVRQKNTTSNTPVLAGAAVGKDGAPSQKPALTAKSKARELTQKINREGLFGSKYLNPQTIGVSVLAGLSVIGGLKGTTLAIKKAGSNLYGPKGFIGVDRYIKNITYLKNKATTQAYKLSQEAKISKKNLDDFSKLQKNIFSYEKEGNLLRKASFLSKQAEFKRNQVIKLAQNIKRVQSETGYNYLKPLVNFWKNNEFKVYSGIGALAALTAYADQTMGKKKKQ